MKMSFLKLARLLLRFCNLKRVASTARSSAVVRPSEPFPSKPAEDGFAAIIRERVGTEDSREWRVLVLWAVAHRLWAERRITSLRLSDTSCSLWIRKLSRAPTQVCHAAPRRQGRGNWRGPLMAPLACGSPMTTLTLQQWDLPLGLG